MRRTNDTTALPVIAWIFAASVALLLTAEVTLAAGGKPLDEPEEQRGRQQAVDCGKRICPGSTVFAKERYKKNIIKGMAEKVLEEGPTRTEWLVRFDDGSMERYYDEDLSSDRPYCNYNDPTTLYNDGIGLYCVGDRVVNVAQYNSWNSNRLRHGHIVGGKGFDSWIVQLEGDDSSQFYEHSGIELAHANSKHCGTHACVEDQVLDRNSPPRPGSVIAITNDGLEYVIEYSGGRSLVRYSSFSVTKKSAVILEDQETTRLENEGIIDRRIYDESRRKGQSHAEALEAARGPVWLSIQETKHFLDRLAQSVYAFDRDYLLGVSGLLSDQSEAEKKFVSLALLPFLKAFGYQQLKQRYIDGSVQRISSFLEKQGVRSLADMEPSFAHRRLALQMLGASLTTSQSQMNDMQKSESARMLSVIGEAAASPLRQKDMQEFLAGAQGLEKLLLDLAQNPYLTARSATDMALLGFLRN